MWTTHKRRISKLDKEHDGHKQTGLRGQDERTSKPDAEEQLQLL